MLRSELTPALQQAGQTGVVSFEQIRAEVDRLKADAIGAGNEGLIGQIVRLRSRFGFRPRTA